MTETKMCMSCLDSDNIYDIFDTHECEGIEEIYVDMLKSCFDISLTPQSGIREMCEKCIMKLRDCFYFKLNIMENIEILEKEIKSMQEKIQMEQNRKQCAAVKTGKIMGKTKDNINFIQIEPTKHDDAFKVSNENMLMMLLQRKKTNNILKKTKDDGKLKTEKGKPGNENKSAGNQSQKPSKPKPLFSVEPGQRECSICKQSFETTKTLYEHMNVHYANHVCEQCGKKFACEMRLARHMKTHLAGPFSCHYCDQVFVKLNTRNSHVWRIHSTSLPYGCTHCEQRFSTFHKRLSHLQTQHGEEKRYHCPHCHLSFFCAGSRSKHIRSTHLKVKNHKCTKCTMGFFAIAQLRNHMATIHNIGEKKFKCAMCDKSFYKNTTFKLHLRRHEEKLNTSYECDFCGAQFTYKAVLRNHILSHQEKPLTTEYLADELMNESVVLEYEDIPDETNETVYFEISNI